jgi:hypothetical protein
LNEGLGYEGVTNCASAAIISVPFGPGRAVLISGRFGGAMVVVDIGSLSFLETACWKTGLLETSWLDKKVETLRQSGGESAKEGC